MIQDSWPHTLNITLHVLCGIVALGLGFVQLLSAKGTGRHVLNGRRFVRASWLVVGTAALGLALFRFNAFLAVLTLLVGYWTFSGVRALRIPHTGPTPLDGAVSISALFAAALFVYYLPRVQLPWVPSIIYSTLSTLVAVALYDLARFTFPKRWFPSLGLYEHLIKMIGAHSAMVAAFFGTVLPSLQPFSQILPPLIWSALQVGFVIHVYRHRQPDSAGTDMRKIA